MGEEKEQIRLTKGLLQLLKVVTGIWGFILLFHFYGYVYISTENQNAKDELGKKVLQVKNKYCISCAFWKVSLIAITQLWLNMLERVVYFFLNE